MSSLRGIKTQEHLGLRKEVLLKDSQTFRRWDFSQASSTALCQNKSVGVSGSAWTQRLSA